MYVSCRRIFSAALFRCCRTGPLMCFLLDLKTHKTHNMGWRKIKNHGIVIEGEALVLHYEDEKRPKTKRFTYAQLAERLAKSKTSDL